MKTLGKFSGKPISSKETGGKDTNVFMGSSYTKSHIYHVKPSFLPVVSHGQNFFPSFILISPICWKLICSVSVGLWTFLFCLHLWRTVLFDTEFLFDSIPSCTAGMSLFCHQRLLMTTAWLYRCDVHLSAMSHFSPAALNEFLLGFGPQQFGQDG